jgi:hypothetical protein
MKEFKYNSYKTVNQQDIVSCNCVIQIAFTSWVNSKYGYGVLPTKLLERLKEQIGPVGVKLEHLKAEGPLGSLWHVCFWALKSLRWILNPSSETYYS